MAQPSYIALELMIDKFSEFIDWVFAKRKKSELEKLSELNLILKSQFDFSVFDVTENTFDVLKIKLEKTDSQILDYIIFTFFEISISTNKNFKLQRLKLDKKLDGRIMEIILYSEKRYNKLSLESSNIKNSLNQKLQLKFTDK